MDGFYTTGEDGIVVGSLTAFTDDSMSIGYYRPRLAFLVQPFSKYISTPPPSAGIFEIQDLAKDGSELTILPYRGPTASLEVIAPPKCSGQIILTSADAGLNVTVNGKAKGGGESVTVIPGSYTILAARLTQPQDTDQPSWLMRVSGAGMPALKVEAGTKQVLVLSGPRVLEFQAALVDGKVNIKTESLFCIKGQSGETYSDVHYDRENPPEVYLNVDGKSTLLGKMEYG